MKGASPLQAIYGKHFERTSERINMTDAQGGDRKAKSTEHHIITMKQLIQINKNTRKPTYITS